MSHITNYYVSQAQTGSGLPFFAGSSSQRGYGLGSFLGGLFRNVVMPFLSRSARSIGLEAARAGSHILADAASGSSIRDSMKRHASEAGTNIISKITSGMQGNGIKRSKITAGVQSGRVARRKRNKQTRDLFT